MRNKPVLSGVEGPPPLASGLYALLDDSMLPGGGLVAAARAVIEGGAKVIQLRLKQTPDREALAVCTQVVALRGAQVLINDRVDLALLSQAAGVHLGDEDLPVSQARALLGPGALIGATTRTLEEIRRARDQGADHVGLGPVFATSTKHVPHALLGIEGLGRIATDSPLPIVAIAGITLENIALVARAGARCAAVAGGLWRSPDLRERAQALQAEFRRI